MASGSAHPGAAGDDAGLVLVQDIDASPAAVWECLTEPACFRSWWRETVEFEPRLGGHLLEPWTDADGVEHLTRAEVTAYHPPHGLVMVWADADWGFDTVVSVSLEPLADGTRVTIEHQGWQAAPEADRAALLLDHRNGWSHHLSRLTDHAHEHDARRKGH